MYLKSLSVKGFKSFAKKTDLEFEPGINMVVGPNGSGKSNITDAIQWVLGEQSPSALRGSAMQDVIFAGSLNHKALGLAEVTLTLDNNDSTLDLDYSEVNVTRRLLRSGENHYFINSTPCRLLDIYELLSDSGIGRQTHSIIGQGKLEEVVNSKPEDKRVLLEEAAGVLKHKKRKERALRKLVSTEENINRAKDILKEVNQQLKPLEFQVTKAKSYNQLTKELRKLEIATLVNKLSNVQNRWQNLTNKEQEIEEKINPLNKQISALTTQISVHEERYQSQAAINAQFQQQKEHLTNLLSSLKNILNLQEHRAGSIKNNNSELKEQFDSIEAQITVKQAQINNLNEQFNNINKDINRNLKAIKEKRKQSEELVPNHYEITNDLSKLQSKLQELENNIKQRQDNKLKKINELTFLAKENEKNKQAIDKLGPEVAQSQKKIEQINKLILENNASIIDLENKIERLIEKKSKWQTQLKEGDSQLASLVIKTFSEAEKLLEIAKAKQKTNIKKELSQSETALASLKQDIALATTSKDTIRQSLKKMIQEAEGFQNKIAELKGNGTKLQADLNFHNQTVDQQKRAHEAHQKSLEIAILTKTTLGKENAEIEAELNSLTKEKISLNKNLATLNSLSSKAADEKQVFQLALTELNYQNKNLTQQISALQNQIQSVESEKEELGKQKKRYLHKFSASEKALSLIEKFLPKATMLLAQSSSVLSKVKEAEIDTDSINKLKELREEEKQFSAQSRELEAQKQQFDVNRSGLKSTLDSLADRLIQEHNIAIETAINEYSGIEVDNSRINDIKSELEQIGPVNAIAEEQYKELGQRKEFMEKQMEDLLNGKASITKIIRAIDKKIKDKLLYAFEEISVNFKQMFAMLFPGGQAELILTGENIFDSGLEIKAQPYGKSPKKMSLLSGGETALTALALLFAVYHTRPSPFYVLDEVEAALDDINLQRFIRLLKDMKTKTQFIVITHQRRTMEVADCLYGVTMQADGVSKIVSQKITDQDQEAVAEEIGVS